MRVIKTNEPIKIILKDGGYGDDECYIYLDEDHYATIHGVHSDKIDEEKVRQWVEETYYSLDYKSSHYIIPRLRGDEFI